MPLKTLLLLLFLLLLLTPFSSKAQEPDNAMSWIASGTAKANYSIDNLGLSITAEGTYQEINLYQARSPYTDLFIGWHLITQDYSGSGRDKNGILHAFEYSNQSALFSLGYDWYLAEFAHLQPFIAYGAGINKTSATDYGGYDTIAPFTDNTKTSDITMYGVNLIFELTGKIWLGYGINYFADSQPIEFDVGDASIETQSSQALLLVWNWERVPIETIDPNASFFGF